MEKTQVKKNGADGIRLRVQFWSSVLNQLKARLELTSSVHGVLCKDWKQETSADAAKIPSVRFSNRETRATAVLLRKRP